MSDRKNMTYQSVLESATTSSSVPPPTRYGNHPNKRRRGGVMRAATKNSRDARSYAIEQSTSVFEELSNPEAPLHPDSFSYKAREMKFEEGYVGRGNNSRNRQATHNNDSLQDKLQEQRQSRPRAPTLKGDRKPPAQQQRHANNNSKQPPPAQEPGLKQTNKQKQPPDKQQKQPRHESTRNDPTDDPHSWENLLAEAPKHNANKEASRIMTTLDCPIPKKDKSHPGVDVDAGFDVARFHRSSRSSPKMTTLHASSSSSSKKRARSKSPIDVDANENDEPAKGQKSRDVVAAIEQGGSTGGFGKMVGSLVSSAENVARKSWAGISQSFMGAALSPSREESPKKAAAKPNPKRKYFGGKKIIPGSSLSKQRRSQRTNVLPYACEDSPEVSPKDVTTRRTRSANATKKQPEEIVIDDSEDEEEEKSFLTPIQVSRIALGSSLVVRKGCCVEATETELILKFGMLDAGKTRQSKGRRVIRRLELDIKNGLQNVKCFTPQHGDVIDMAGESEEVINSSFLVLTMTLTETERVEQICDGWGIDFEQADRCVSIEFRNQEELWHVLSYLESNSDTDDTIHLDESKAQEYFARLCPDETYDPESPRKKRRTFDPVFLRGREEEDVVLVYPFAGDKTSIERASSGLEVLGNFGRDSDSELVLLDQAEKEESGGSRGHTLTISVGDCKRLAPGTFLNDTLIDFFMQWMSRNDKHNGESQTHYFSTHFYSMLCEQGPQGVQRWTAKKGIDIFEKRLIFVPVNKSLHWSLAVIVNPGAIKSQLDLIEKGGSVKIVDESFERPDDLDKPCPVFLFFDSLKCHPKKAVAKKLREWLNAEWGRRKGATQEDAISPFNAKSMMIVDPKAPGQLNGYDCGVFVCRNAYAVTLLRHRLFSYADFGYPEQNAKISMFEESEGKEAFSFDHGDIDRLRENLLKLIENLSFVYAQWRTQQQQKRREAKALKNGESDLSSSGANTNKMNAYEANPGAPGEPEDSEDEKVSRHGAGSLLARSSSQNAENAKVLSTTTNPKSSLDSSRPLVEDTEASSDEERDKKPEGKKISKVDVDFVSTEAKSHGILGLKKVNIAKKHRTKKSPLPAKEGESDPGLDGATEDAADTDPGCHVELDSSHSKRDGAPGKLTNRSEQEVIDLDAETNESSHDESTARRENSAPESPNGSKTNISGDKGAEGSVEIAGDGDEASDCCEPFHTPSKADFSSFRSGAMASADDKSGTSPSSQAYEELLPHTDDKWSNVEHVIPHPTHDSLEPSSKEKVINLLDDEDTVGGTVNRAFDMTPIDKAISETKGDDNDDDVEVLDSPSRDSKANEVDSTSSESTQSTKENLRNGTQSSADAGRDGRQEMEIEGDAGQPSKEPMSMREDDLQVFDV